jgi:hypothetical protein
VTAGVRGAEPRLALAAGCVEIDQYTTKSPRRKTRNEPMISTCHRSRWSRSVAEIVL